MNSMPFCLFLFGKKKEGLVEHANYYEHFEADILVLEQPLNTTLLYI